MSHPDPRIRDDAILHQGRPYVPTTEETVWVHTLEEFRTVGGCINWSEDQSYLTLTLPVGHKFSIQFLREHING